MRYFNFQITTLVHNIFLEFGFSIVILFIHSSISFVVTVTSSNSIILNILRRLVFNLAQHLTGNRDFELVVSLFHHISGLQNSLDNRIYSIISGEKYEHLFLGNLEYSAGLFFVCVSKPDYDIFYLTQCGPCVSI